MHDKTAFLNELFKMNECRVQLLDFLINEKCYSDDDKQRLLVEHKLSHSSKIVALLDVLIKAEKIQSVEYTWSILPHHVVKVNIVGMVDSVELVGIK